MAGDKLESHTHHQVYRVQSGKQTPRFDGGFTAAQHIVELWLLNNDSPATQPKKIITFLDFGLYFGRWCCISRHQDAIFHSRNSLLMLQTDLFVHRMALYWTLPSYCSSSTAHLRQIKNRTVPTFMDSDTKWRNLHKVKEFKLDKGGLHGSGAPCLLKPVLIH